MAQHTVTGKRGCQGFLSRCVLVAYALLNTPPLVCAEILQNMHYVYDNVGNVTSIGDQITLPNTQTLTYDDLDRLDVATGNYGIFDFNYDAIGNVVVNPQLGPNTTYAYRSDGVRPHAVCATGAPGVACPPTNPPYDYDANGNLVTGNGRSYTWNIENKPTSIMTGATSSSGLVAAYGFNEGTGTTAADNSGTSSAATLTNVTWAAPGKYGTGLTFNGTSSYGQIPPPATPLRLTNAMTVEVWMNAATLPTGWHTLMSRQFGTGVQDSWGLFTRGTNLEFYTNSTTFIAAPVTTGTWTHVAGVLDGTAVRLYVNGTLVATGTTTVPIPNDDNEVVIGASSNGNPLISEFFNGTLDEIRVYNRALSQAEIQTDMNTPITATLSGSIMTTFVYDGEGGRVKKSVGGTTTRYISPLYECDNSSCSRYIWAGDTRIAILPDTPTGQPCDPACYFHADHLSSTNLVTGSTGSRVETITYQPYGEIQSDSPGTPVNTPYKYTGQERDASTGLLYYEARYYDPRLGRFISPDSIVTNLRVPQDLNRYTYARNNPMLYTDPSGHCPICIGIGIGILIGVISSGIQSDWDLKSTLIGGVIGGASAGVGAGVASSVYSATLSTLGGTWASVAGGVVGGAAAGGTSAVLANAVGYRVNIGLAIASGAAAGGITGGAYGQWGELGALAAAPVAGASAAAISGADPGVGALIAASTAAFSLGIQELAGQLAPAQMGTRTGISGNKLSMTDVADALDVIGKSNLVVDPPPGFADSPGIAAKLNTMFESGDIIFGQTYREGARAQTWLGKITLNSRNINAGFCPKCDLPGTLFHEGVHAFYGDRFTNAFVENRAFLFQYKLEMSLYNDPAARIKPLSPPQLYQVR